MKFKGVIFDLDGTLVDSVEDLADSMNIVLDKYDFPVHSLQDYRFLVGDGIRCLVHNALPEGSRSEETIDKCYDTMIEIYRDNCTRKSRPYGGIVEMLDWLIMRGVRLAVLSNKADELTKKVVMDLFPDICFEEIIGLTSEDLRKPDPRVALRIAGNIGVDPGEMAFVGDSGVDMQTANNAGMYGVGALWGFRTKEELISHGAKHLLSSPHELSDVYNS